MTRTQNTTYLPLFPIYGNGTPVGAEGEVVVVNFCGIGGSCEGLKNAMKRPPTHAINHNPVAIGLHRRNLPHTHHHLQDVWSVNPADLAGGRKIAVAWFSPDCTHFSRAKGGKPKEQKIRDLAWVTEGYAALPEHEKPRIIFLENVAEFMTWGPLDDAGQPIKARAGETFRAFIAMLEGHGYQVEYRVLTASDYGAPTSRKRFFLIARSDGEAIHWPEPTHGNPKSKAVQDGKLLPWRTAADCIDWNIPAPSVFSRIDPVKGKPMKPLAKNTMLRIARGLKKFVKECGKPFIVPEGDAAAFLTNKQFGNESRSVDAPLATITTNHNKQELVTANLVHFYGVKSSTEVRGQSLDTPLKTQTTENRHGLVTASLIKHYGGGYTGAGSAADAPISTITAHDHNGLLLSNLIRFNGTNDAGPCDKPLGTLTTKERFGLSVAALAKRCGPHVTDAYELMLAYAPECLTERDHAARAVFVEVDGEEYVIADVYMRMLTPRELARGQSFSDDYVLEFTADGKPVTKTDQVAGIGNSVPPIMAEVLCRANLPFGSGLKA